MNPSGKCVLLLTNNNGNKIAKIIDKIGQTVRTYEKMENSINTENKEKKFDNEMNNTMDNEVKRKCEDDKEEKLTKIKFDLHLSNHKNNNDNNDNSNNNNSNSNNNDNDNNSNNNDNNSNSNNNDNNSSNHNTHGGRKTETHVWNHEDLKMEFQPETWEVSLVATLHIFFANFLTKFSLFL